MRLDNERESDNVEDRAGAAARGRAGALCVDDPRRYRRHLERYFPRRRQQLRKPKLVLFNGAVRSACGFAAASAIGDDRLQKQARGHVSPESFTHGSSEQRVRWFHRGNDDLWT